MKFMYSKKIKFILMVVLTMSLLLNGCGSKTTPPEPQQPAQTNEQSNEGKNTETAFPEKPITMIVPWSAGGGTDLIFRKLSDVMSKDIGQPIVVMNVEGGGGQVGFQQINASAADGYTVGVITNSMLLQKITQGTKLGAQDFTVLSMVNYDAAALTVNAESPYNSVAEFVEAAKANPGKLRVGNSGAKAIWHITAMLMEKETGIQVTHVPYEGANPAAVAVAGGHIEAVTVSAGEVKGLVEGGKLKMLGLMSDERSKTFPDVPTFKEEGIDLQFGVWRALVAPKGIPADVVAKLEASVQKAVEGEDFKKFMADNEFGIYFKPAAEAQEFITNEETTLKDVIGE